MVLVDILDCLLRHDFRLEQLTAVRSNSHVLELKPVGLFRVLLHNDNVLDTNAEFTILVEARLVTNAHSFGERDSASATNADRALMDTKAASDAVTSAMPVVKAFCHQVAASEVIKVASVVFRGFRPDDLLKIQVAHEDTRVAVLLEVCGLGEMNSPRDVRSAIEVLTTRVKQIDLLVVHSLGSALLGTVVDDCAVGPN